MEVPKDLEKLEDPVKFERKEENEDFECNVNEESKPEPPVFIDLKDEGGEEREEGKGNEREVEPRSDHSWNKEMEVKIDQLPGPRAFVEIQENLINTRTVTKWTVRALLGLITQGENYKKGIRLVKGFEEFVKE